MKDVRQQILDLQKEISALSKKTFEKLALLDALVKDTLEPLDSNVIELKFHWEETKYHYKTRIKSGTKIGGSLYIPKRLDIQPDKVVLKRK